MLTEIGLTTIAIGTALLYYGVKGLRTTKPNSTTAPNAAPKLGIELVPLPMQGYNVRSRISPNSWKSVCTETHRKANAGAKHYTCEICHQTGKSQGFPHPVECHEIWDYDDQNHIQKLTGLLTLCPLCHKAKHYGLSKKSGYEQRVRQHMLQVNNWTEHELNAHIAEAFCLVKQRSQEYWTLDLTYLNDTTYRLGTMFTDDEKDNCEKPILF
jgi:hypothetical protein